MYVRAPPPASYTKRATQIIVFELPALCAARYRRPGQSFGTKRQYGLVTGVRVYIGSKLASKSSATLPGLGWISVHFVATQKYPESFYANSLAPGVNILTVTNVASAASDASKWSVRNCCAWVFLRCADDDSFPGLFNARLGQVHL